ncbi:alpha-galactosidase [Pedobacter sp. B4-66]|uniref:alpha-galactosidase n=1 Tax=Pedobacter sp. B4-66 TaxID=2817280 RepID=UPI001BD94F19|nr:alpha-galactosidase [Pedobacter sp. B4-66]
MFRRLIFLSLAFSVLIALSVQGFSLTKTTDSRVIHISYGTSSDIVYNLNSGTYEVFSNKKKIIANAYALVKNNEESISSKDYEQIKFEEAAIKDKFGVGKKYTIILTKSGLPQMEQVFYVYPGHDYFLTEVSLKGSGVKSNYMAPLVSNGANIYAKGDVRTLFVPFDNDTFIRYNAKPMGANLVENTSSEVGAIYENQTRKGLILGSVEHMVWKTGVLSKGTDNSLTELSVWGGYTDEKVTRDKVAHGFISGSAVKSPKVFVGYFSDWRTGLEAYGKANRIAEPPFVFNWTKPVPFGWNSWGVIQEKLTYEKAVKNVDFFADELPKFRNDSTAYIDLDSFWDNFTGGMRGDYSKLKEFADYCKSKGLQPGVYWAPFTDWGFKSGGDREAEGSKYKFGEMWTKVGGAYHDFDGARALDPTHPGTKKRIDFIIDKLKVCGFKMIKIDFLGHAAAESDIFYDKSVTTGMQAYRAGMEYLINRMDGKMLVYAAISPNMATGRYAHIKRIACDAWKTIKDTEYTLNSVNYGWWQTFVYNYLDADHIVFSNEKEGANRARLTSGLITGTLIMGDDFSSPGVWNETAKKLLNNEQLLAIPKSGVAFMPVNGNTGEQSNELFVRKIGNSLYLAILNFDGKKKLFTIPLDRLGIKNSSYKAKELFSGKNFRINKTLKYELNGADASIIKIELL